MLKTRWPVSPFLGRRFQGRLETTLVRGTVPLPFDTVHVWLRLVG